MRAQAIGKTEASPFPQWFFEGDSIMGDLPEPIWTSDETAVINAALSQCLDAWQAHQGHLWRSNFWHIIKQDRSDGPCYLAWKSSWQNSHIYGHTPEELAEEIKKQFK